MESFLQDIRFGMRTLRKSPGFVAAAVLILGLGIGANTIIFSVVNALVFRPLPYRDPERLLAISAASDRLKSWGPLSYPDFLDYRDQNRVLEDTAALAPEGVNITGTEEPVHLRGLRLSAEAIPLLGLPMKIGRPFLEEECVDGRGALVILSHALWQNRFGSRPDILGQSITVNGAPHSVAGVFGPDARLGYLLGFEPELCLPLLPPNPPQRGSHQLIVIGRLKAGVSLRQSQEAMAVIARGLERQYPDTNSGWSVLVSELRPRVDPVAYVLLTLLVSSVLGIACTNVANLLLARTSSRAKELAIRGALGAGRGRLMRQLLTESSLLALLGCGVGVLIAFGACDLIRAYSSGSNLEIVDVRPDPGVLAATLLLLVSAAIAVGLVPALKFSGGALCQSLKQGFTGSSGASSKNGARAFLAAFEIALSLIMLVVGGLAIKSWFGLWHVDPGYKPGSVLAMTLPLTDASYKSQDRRTAFLDRLLQRLEARSEIRSAGIASALPTMAPRFPFIIEGRARPAPGEEALARCTSADPGYFTTMSIALKAGRLFTERDAANAPRVAVVNETLARKYWPGASPLGERIEVWGAPRTIVGIIGDLRSVPLALRPQPEVYVPFAQSTGAQVVLAVNAAGELSGVSAVLKEEIRALDANQAVDRLQRMDEIRARDMGVISLGSRLLGILAVSALVLAAVGLYGVLSYSAANRRPEFGIRMALGAGRRDIQWLVLRQGITVALWGIVPGAVAAFLLTIVLSRKLYGIAALEPLLLCGLALLLAAVALLAGYLPARRATRVDPMVALRFE